jgi:hypothetical protein
MANLSTQFCSAHDFAILDIGRHPDASLTGHLSTAFDQTEHGLEQAEQTLRLVEDGSIHFFKTHIHRTTFEKERIATVQVIVRMCRQVQKNHGHMCRKNGRWEGSVEQQMRTCINPAFFHFIEESYDRLTKENSFQPPNFTECPSSVLFAPSLAKAFTVITGWTSRGLVGVPVNEIQRVLDSDLVNCQPLACYDIRFTLYTYDQSTLLLQGALHGYAQWLAQHLNPSRVYFPQFCVDARCQGVLSLLAPELRVNLDSVRKNFHSLINPEESPRLTAALLPFFDCLFALDYNTYQGHDKFCQFLRLCRHARSIPEPAITQFQIPEEAVRDRELLLQAVLHMRDDEVEDVAASLLGTPPEFAKQRAAFHAAITDLNSGPQLELPFDPFMKRMLDAQNQAAPRVLVQVEARCVRQLSAAAFALTVRVSTGSVASTVTLIVERVAKARVARTWARALAACGHIIGDGYNARRRGCQPPTAFSWQIGDCFLVTEFAGTEVTTVADANAESYVCQAATKKDACALRAILSASCGAAIALRALFGMELPPPDRLLLVQGKLFVTAGDMGIPSSAARVPLLPPLRLPQLGLGPTARGEAVIAMAAAAQALLAELERFRGVCEWVIVDTYNGEISPSQLFVVRDVMDAALFRLAPPASSGADPQDSVRWLNEIIEGLSTAP